MACNEINITFPEAFGTPSVMPAQNSYLAAFPPHVLTLTRIDGVMQASRAIGRGAQADEALKRLFEEFADVGRYDAIMVADPHDRSKGSLFQHVIRPYSTITFMKSSLRLREPTYKFS